MCIFAGNSDSTFSGSYAPFELRNWAKIKHTSETNYHRNSYETTQQTFVELCCYKGHTVEMCLVTGNFDSIFSGNYEPF